MFKQPAENTNATPAEAQAAEQRVRPLPKEPGYEEIAAIAKQLWISRGGTGGSAEDDWFRAEHIARQRLASIAGAPAGGNASGENESYVAGTGVPRTGADLVWKERNTMNNPVGGGTGTMEQSGSMTDRVNELKNKATDMMQNMENEPQSFPKPEHREGRLARTIEQQTAKIPSDAWLWAAVGSMGLSLALELSGKEKTANFVGHWVPTLLIFGLYNKLVKLQGSDGI